MANRSRQAAEVEGGGMNDLERYKKLKDSQGQTYSTKINCLNCGEMYVATIQKGVLISQSDPACPKCGCTPNQVGKSWGNQAIPSRPV